MIKCGLYKLSLLIFLAGFFLCGPAARIVLAQNQEDKSRALEQGIHSPKPFSYYESISKRNLFKPLWRVEPKVDSGAEQREADAAKRKLEAELKRLKAGLKLSGIVNNGEYSQAIIQDKRKGGGNFFYKEGDVIQDVKVISINEDKLEVILDFKGEEVILDLISEIKKTGKSPSSSREDKIQTSPEVRKRPGPREVISPRRPPASGKAKDRNIEKKKLILKLLPLRGYLGIDVQEITPGLARKLQLSFDKGLYIVRVRGGSQADKESLRRGDLILGINEQKVTNLKDIQRVFDKVEPDEKISLTVVKDRSQIEQTLIIELSGRGVD